VTDSSDFKLQNYPIAKLQNEITKMKREAQFLASRQVYSD
jgi:hypothetical protein